MADRPIAVLGGGNGAHMMAVDLTYRGHKVHLFEHSEFRAGFQVTLERKAIESSGVGPRGRFPIERVTMDMGEALEGVEWINVVIPANGHDLFFAEMIPYLRDDQKVVVWAGDYGSLRLKALLREKHGVEVTIIETNTLPYGTRLREPGWIELLLVAPHVMASAIPAKKNAEIIEPFKSLFPCIDGAKNVFACAFNNPNPIVHPPGSLLNTGRIQYAKGNFYMYREGITEAVARVIREVYNESGRVAARFDVEMIPYEDTDFDTTVSIMGVEFVAPFDTMGEIASILGPTSVDDRYITEDLPYGLVPRSELGRVVGVTTPLIDSLITIGSVVCRNHYWTTGRTLRSLGLDGWSREEILQALNG